MPAQIVRGFNVSTSVFFVVNRFWDISYGLLIRYCMVLQKTGQGCQCQLWIQVLLFFFLLLLFASQALEILCRPRIASSSNGLYQSLTGRCKNFFLTSVHIFLGSNYIWYICKLSWPCFLTITSVHSQWILISLKPKANLSQTSVQLTAIRHRKPKSIPNSQESKSKKKKTLRKSLHFSLCPINGNFRILK